MASIYGFKLKNVKTFPGRDWEGVTADLWYKGKKVAFYSDYGDGAGGTVQYYNGRPGKDEYEPKLTMAIKRMAEDERFEAETRTILKDSDYLSGEDIFIAELVQLTDDEKQYKKFVKQGCTCVAFYQRTNGKYYAQSFPTGSEEKIEQVRKDPTVSHFTLRNSIEEFDIGE